MGISTKLRYLRITLSVDDLDEITRYLRVTLTQSNPVEDAAIAQAITRFLVASNNAKVATRKTRDRRPLPIPPCELCEKKPERSRTRCGKCGKLVCEECVVSPRTQQEEARCEACGG